MKEDKLIKKIESTIISTLKKEGGDSGLKHLKKAIRYDIKPYPKTSKKLGKDLQ